MNIQQWINDKLHSVQMPLPDSWIIIVIMVSYSQDIRFWYLGSLLGSETMLHYKQNVTTKLWIM